MTEKEAKILAMQQPSTRKALRESEADRKLHVISPITDKAQCTKEDGSVDLRVREISEEEYGLFESTRRGAGATFEEARTNYLMAKAKEGKIHHSLLDKIETNHVMPTLEQKQRAEKAFMGILQTIKQKFQDIISHLIKPSHAEIIAEEIRKKRDEE